MFCQICPPRLPPTEEEIKAVEEEIRTAESQNNKEES
jgi:hypothetical protein